MKIKNLFVALVLLVSSFVFAPSQGTAKNIYAYSDTGRYIYLSQTTNVTRVYQLNKPVMVWTQQNSIYVKADDGTIFQTNYVNDSITIEGAKPVSVAAGAAKLRAISSRCWKNYNSAVTTVALIKAGRGELHTISIDSIGVGGKGTCTIWDGATTADTASTNTPLFSGTITAVGYRLKDVQYSKGLVIKQKTTTAGRVNVSYYLVQPYADYEGNNRLYYNLPYRHASSF